MFLELISLIVSRDGRVQAFALSAAGIEIRFLYLFPRHEVFTIDLQRVTAPCEFQVYFRQVT